MQRAIGDLELSLEGRLLGWCWSADRPTERMVVELLVNGRVATTFTASRFNKKAVEQGLNDGLHGFSIRLPDVVGDAAGPGALNIEARERVSGSVFGRVVRRGVDVHQAHASDILELSSKLRELMLQITVEDKDRATPYRDLSNYLLGISRDFEPTPSKPEEHSSVMISLQKLRREKPVFLRYPHRPLWTYIYLAEDSIGALREIEAAAPLLERSGGSLIIVDVRADPLVALLPVFVQNSLLLRLRKGDPLARVVNDAALRGRGEHLVVGNHIRGIETFSAIAQLKSHHTARIGAELTRIAKTLKLPLGATAGDIGLPGTQLMIPKSVFFELGGFDEGIGDDARLLMLDVALKASLIGVSLVVETAITTDGSNGEDDVSEQFASRWLSSPL